MLLVYFFSFLYPLVPCLIYLTLDSLSLFRNPADYFLTLYLCLSVSFTTSFPPLLILISPPGASELADMMQACTISHVLGSIPCIPSDNKTVRVCFSSFLFVIPWFVFLAHSLLPAHFLNPLCCLSLHSCMPHSYVSLTVNNSAASIY